MNESIKRWMRTLAISFVIFLIFSAYLYLRQGHYNIDIINKVFGSTAVVLAGMALLVGPLRQISFVATLMTIRRQIGLLAFGFAVLHIIVSITQTEQFSWYLTNWIPVGFGIVAIFIWLYMTYISRNTKIAQLGADVWKNRLSLAGKLAFLAIFLHLTIMKYTGWIKWWNGQNPSYPPSSLFIFILMLLVIFYRILHDFMKKRGAKNDSNAS